MLNPTLKLALPLAVFSLGAAITGTAHAWEPTKPVEIIVPFSAGGATDQFLTASMGMGVNL